MKLLILAFLFTSLNAISQEIDFDSLFTKTSREVIGIEPEVALKNIDLLYDLAENNIDRSRSLILKGEFLMYYGLNEEAQTVFIESVDYALKNKDYISLTRIYGYISSIYRGSELYTPSLKYLEKASLAIDKIDDKYMRWRFRGNLEQEKSNIEMERKNFQKSIDFSKKSIYYFSKIKTGTTESIHYQLTISNGLISKNYLFLNEVDSSILYLNKAQAHLNKSGITEDPLQGSIFNGYAEAYLAKKSYEKAEGFLLKAEKVAEDAHFFELKKEVYKSMYKFYAEVGQYEKSNSYDEKLLKLIEQDDKSRKLVSGRLLDSLYDQQSKLEVSQKKNAQVILWLVIFSFLLICLLSWYIYNKKSNQKKFTAYIQTLNQKPIKKEIITKSDSTKSYISEEKEKSILESLTDLEKTHFYLDENISLTVLSSKIGVNQRYLTYVIKQHLASDFATYINELRINHIVNCLKTDPKYLTYKISYLAKSCGFSSHSRFTINFKKMTGTTPSAFINYIRKENNKFESTI